METRKITFIGRIPEKRIIKKKPKKMKIMKPFNLSNKRKKLIKDNGYWEEGLYREEDVKQAVKLLKESLTWNDNYPLQANVHEIINKIFGEKLT